MEHTVTVCIWRNQWQRLHGGVSGQMAPCGAQMRTGEALRGISCL